MKISDYAYNLALAGGLIGALPILASRLVLRGKYRRTFRRRLGLVGPEFMITKNRPVWFHALSLGEVITAATVIDALLAARPGLPVVLSVATENGLDEARRRFQGREGLQVLVAPMDFPWTVRRLVGTIGPRLFVLVETDAWPNLLDRLRRRGVPLVLVNGRLSPGSYRLWRRLGGIARRMWGRFDLCLMQSAIDADRVRGLGLDPRKTMTVGNVKYDRAWPEAVDPAALRGDLGLPADVPVVVAGSTHHGEERIVLDAFLELRRRLPRVRLILAPRQPERFDEAAGLVAKAGLSLARRSAGGREADVILLDTMGELARVYAVADAAFVGGSLAYERGVGGHNLLEPAVFGAPVLFGPNMKNFPEMRREFLQAKAGLEVTDAPGLAGALERLLTEPDFRAAVGRAAAAVAARHRGATALTVTRLLELMS
jgi:3-deoxy-D-manno-octulosonic-acid transferase